MTFTDYYIRFRYFLLLLLWCGVDGECTPLVRKCICGAVGGLDSRFLRTDGRGFGEFIVEQTDDVYR